MSKELTRRSLGKRGLKLAGGAVAATSAMQGQPQTGAGTRVRAPYSYPGGFKWGLATAAYQIEGAAAEDGRKPSTWDTYSHTPGRVANGDTGDVANDHYHLYKKDVQLLKETGVSTYRYSISWPRVIPNGTGAVNEKGLAFYDRLTDELLANNIEPYVTLFHWDLPQALEDSVGGWQSRETAKAFADYATVIAKRLSDRVKNFFTMNEFSCFIDEGYGSGTKAPGKKVSRAVLNQTRHNAVLGHGLAVQALRASQKSPLKIGIAENSAICVPIYETADHIAAAGKAMRDLNAQYLTVILEGRYLDSYLSREGQNAPKFTADDLRIIGSPLDFVGLNIYTPTQVRAADNPSGFAVVPKPKSYPHMESQWLTIGPEIGYWAPRHLGELWKVKEAYITENGCSSDDHLASDGQVYDSDRIMYVRNHLLHGHRAVTEGWPLNGYFWWSLMDNFEWTDGYGKRFGIYYVDFKTQQRTPKMSAKFYRDLIKENRVL